MRSVAPLAVVLLLTLVPSMASAQEEFPIDPTVVTEECAFTVMPDHPALEYCTDVQGLADDPLAEAHRHIDYAQTAGAYTYGFARDTTTDVVEDALWNANQTVNEVQGEADATLRRPCFVQGATTCLVPGYGHPGPSPDELGEEANHTGQQLTDEAQRTHQHAVNESEEAARGPYGYLANRTPLPADPWQPADAAYENGTATANQTYDQIRSEADKAYDRFTEIREQPCLAWYGEDRTCVIPGPAGLPV